MDRRRRPYYGNDSAPYWVDRRNNEREGQGEEERRKRDFDRRWEKDHRPHFERLEEERREFERQRRRQRKD